MQKDFPLVSVLICAYNTEKYMAQCLDAIINQTYKNLEVIVVNDGSTDNTLNLIKSFSKKDSRIILINNNENYGFVKSLNIGLSYAHGEYIARTDADDITEANWIETLIQELIKNSDIIAIGSYIKILSQEGNQSNLSHLYKDGEIWKNPLTHEEISEKMLFKNVIHNNSMIMRSSIYKQYGLTFDENYKYAEDYKFWLEASRLGKLANYPEALVHYRLNNNQISSIYSKEQMETAKRIRKIAINYYFQDQTIDFKLGEKIYFDEIESLIEKLKDKSLLSNNIIQNLLYDFYLSLEEYKIDDMFKFIKNNRKYPLTLKQKIKIIKKFIRTKKYEPRI